MRERRTREIAAQSLAQEVVVGQDMDARMEIEALVHDGFRNARRRLGRFGFGGLTGILRRLEREALHPGEGHGFAQAVRRRLF